MCSRIEDGPDDSFFCRRDISCSHTREKTHDDKSNHVPSGKMLIRTETPVGNMGAEQQKSGGGEETRNKRKVISEQPREEKKNYQRKG